MRAVTEFRSPPSAVILTLLAVAAGLSVVAFMTLGAQGNWDFVLPFRGRKLLAIALVGYAIAVSTVLFQTVTNNRILTPSIMGFDQLYVLIQTLLVFFMGTVGVSGLDPRLQFVAEVGAMVAFSGLLYRWLFSGGMKSLHLLLLVGIIFGVLFRSLAGFLQRIMDPNAFAVLQDRMFASFNTVDTDLLGMAAISLAVVTAVGWRIRDRFDVLTLGREPAIALGVDHRRTVAIILVLVAIMVSVSTALVGPVTFFGLLVANLAYTIVPSHKHRWILPTASLLAILCLVGGQVILERVFAFNTALSIIIEFVGGLAFIFLLIRGAAR